MNKHIVRLLLKYTETMSHEGRLIQVIPNGYIKDIADEIEDLVNKNSVIHGVMPCGDCSTKTSPCRTINCQYDKIHKA